MPVIEADELSKSFRVTHKAPGLAGAIRALFAPQMETKVALQGVSFSVEPGELVGYIGINGAGKSTTIKILTGILVPSGGTVRVLGRDPHRQRVANAREIAAVFGQRTQLQWDLPLTESLTLIGKIYEIEPARYRQLLRHYADLLQLDELLHVPTRQMSLGQKMRAELAAVLIHEPKVLYLDEPTIGLDLLVKERIREAIKAENRERGTTVILTTHDLGDIEELCRRVMIIDAGRLIYDGPLETIRRRFGTYRTITFETGDVVGNVPLPPGSEEVERSEHSMVVRFHREQVSASQVAAAVMNQLDVRDFALAEPSLTSIIKEIYSGALREGATP